MERGPSLTDETAESLSAIDEEDEEDEDAEEEEMRLGGSEPSWMAAESRFNDLSFGWPCWDSGWPALVSNGGGGSS
jgi:hypothetical protein